MKVHDLQLFLQHVSTFAIAAGASKPVQTDLERVQTALAPFAELEIAKFGELLQLAHSYHTEGKLEIAPAKASKAKATKAVKQPADTQSFIQRLNSLFDDVLQESVGYNVIDSMIDELDKSLTKDEAVVVYHGFGFKGKPAKKVALDAIKQKLYQRKGSYQTVQAIKG